MLIPQASKQLLCSTQLNLQTLNESLAVAKRCHLLCRLRMKHMKLWFYVGYTIAHGYDTMTHGYASLKRFMIQCHRSFDINVRQSCSSVFCYVPRGPWWGPLEMIASITKWHHTSNKRLVYKYIDIYVCNMYIKYIYIIYIIYMYICICPLTSERSSAKIVQFCTPSDVLFESTHTHTISTWIKCNIQKSTKKNESLKKNKLQL